MLNFDINSPFVTLYNSLTGGAMLLESTTLPRMISHLRSFKKIINASSLFVVTVFIIIFALSCPFQASTREAVWHGKDKGDRPCLVVTARLHRCEHTVGSGLSFQRVRFLFYALPLVSVCTPMCARHDLALCSSWYILWRVGCGWRTERASRRCVCCTTGRD